MTVIVGDCVTIMARMPEASIDSVVCDPPYGLSGEPDMAEVLRHWLAGDDFKHRGGGFMGRSWDSFVPGPVYWKAAFRVLKPGGYLLAFGGTRTFDLLVTAIRLSGFEIRDRILMESAEGGDAHEEAHPTELAWIYGSGFPPPKSQNVSKAIDKAAGAEREVIGQTARCVGPSQKEGYLGSGTFRGGTNNLTAPATDEAARWAGYGTALKPAHEPICVARKPLVGTVAANVLEHGTGALNIDACRIGTEQAFVDRLGRKSRGGILNITDDQRVGTGGQGRWPANVVLLHAEGCERIGTKRVRGNPGGTPQPTLTSKGHTGGGFGNASRLSETHEPNEAAIRPSHADEDGMEEIEAWECVPGCPVAALDAQSGSVRTSGVYEKHTNGLGYRGGAGTEKATMYADFGGASRFFYTAKASRSEREAGLLGKVPCTRCGGLDTTEHEALTTVEGWRTEGFKCRKCGRWRHRCKCEEPDLEVADLEGRKSRCIRNDHPTVKPVGVMRWLLRLVAPPGAVVLDPFAGSGTTLCAGAAEGIAVIGIEEDERSALIADARAAHWAGKADRERAAAAARGVQLTLGGEAA